MRQQRKKLSDVITEQLESMILDGTLLAGQKLPPERELALEFDVSRPSLREAIGNLQARGRAQARWRYVRKSQPEFSHERSSHGPCQPTP